MGKAMTSMLKLLLMTGSETNKIPTVLKLNSRKTDILVRTMMACHFSNASKVTNQARVEKILKREDMARGTGATIQSQLKTNQKSRKPKFLLVRRFLYNLKKNQSKWLKKLAKH